VTAEESPPSPPAPVHRKDQPVVGMWASALVLGVVVALLGVNAAIGSLQRKQYSEARVEAVYLLRNGNAISDSMLRLHEVNLRDYNLVKDTQTALEAGNMPVFNRLVAQADVFSVEQRSLQQKVQDYKAGFDQTSKR
jgi:hypothetical protein